MGYVNSTVHGIPVPDSAQANNVPEDIGLVVTALEGGSLVRRLTGAAIAALSAGEKPAGLVVYNTTVGVLQVSDGTNFRDVPSLASSGAWTAWTPVISQPGAITWNAGTSRARYIQVGKTVHAHCALAITGAGTAGQEITLSLPVTAAAADAGGGTWLHNDVGGGTIFAGTALMVSTTLVKFIASGATNFHGKNAGTLSNTDAFYMTLTYEAA